METYEIVLLSLLGLIILFLAVLIIRALAFKPNKMPEIIDEEVQFDKEKAQDALSMRPPRPEMIRSIAV